MSRGKRFSTEQIVRKQRHPKTQIICEDEEGRVIDLHAMRTTLGTMLVQQGVAPQLAQKIMRHSDYKTTLSHYTVLGLTDTAKAIEALPQIDDAPNKTAMATSTIDARPGVDPPAISPATEARNGASKRK